MACPAQPDHRSLPTAPKPDTDPRGNRTGASSTSESVVLLLTDVVGSTRMWSQHPAEMDDAMRRHHEIVHATMQKHGGVRSADQGEGDSSVTIFTSAPAALAAGVELQRLFAAEPWQLPAGLTVRMSIHAGDVIRRDGNVWGDTINHCARIRALAAGGQTLLSGAAADLVRVALPNDLMLRDLGEHRLKDVERPIRIFQVDIEGLPVDFPPLPSIARHNLPAPLTNLIGRAGDIRRVKALLGAHRLVTLTGPGGIGKTRLSMAIAGELLTHFPDGVWLVDLASATCTTDVAASIASVLGIVESEGGPLRAVEHHLTGRRLLLVLDNLEQVLVCAPFLAGLLKVHENLRILATSRAPLRIAGERQYSTPPLALGAGEASTHGHDTDNLASVPAVALFLERASAARHGFGLTQANAPAIEGICRRLEGHPLAIELAAARVQMLSPDALLDRLGSALGLLTAGSADMPARHQTLRASVASSYDVTAPHLQRVLDRMSIFPGDAGLSAIEAICNETDPTTKSGDILDAVSNLVDASLVRRGADEAAEARFSLHVGIREFAAEKLAASGQEETTRRRHACYYADLGRLPMDWTPQQFESCLAAVSADLHNTRAALAFIQEHGSPEAEINFSPMHCEVLLAQGHYAEAIASADHALGRHPGPALGRAEWAITRAWVRYVTNPRSRDWLGPFQEVAAQTKALDASTYALMLGYSSAAIDDATELRRVLAESDAVRAALPELGNRYPLRCLQLERDINFSMAMRYIEPELARVAGRRLFTSSDDVDDADFGAVARIRLGMLLCDQGDFDAAEVVLAPFERGDSGAARNWEAEGLMLCARMRLGHGKYETAQDLAARSRGIYDELGAEPQVAELDLVLAECALLRRELVTAENRVRAALARTDRVADRVGHAAAIWRLAKTMRHMAVPRVTDPPLTQARDILIDGEVRHFAEWLGCLVEAAHYIPAEQAAIVVGAVRAAANRFVIPFDGNKDLVKLHADLEVLLGEAAARRLGDEGAEAGLRGVADLVR